jgi:diacylglycerol kinase
MMRRFLGSLGHAMDGLLHTGRTQPNMRIHLAFACLAICLAAALRLAALEWAVIVALIAAVLAAECLNTAIEAALDRVSMDEHPLSRAAKDASAAAVLVLAAASVVSGAVIYVNALLRMSG